MNATLINASPVAHAHHERLVKHVDRMPRTGDLIDSGQSGELKIALDETCAFLSDLLVPHIEATERALYPELERVLQNRHSMTPMRREHDLIRAEAKKLDAMRARVGDQPLPPRDAVKLRRTIFQLYALLKIHMAEELLYADMVEHGASVEREAALAVAMEHSGITAF